MSKRTPLDDFQRVQGLAYRNVGKGVKEIAHISITGANAISNFI